MSPEAKMQPDAFERLRSALERQPWGHDSLAKYVSELAQDTNEEEIFRRMAFCGESADAYEALNPDDRAQLRRWWHEKIRREAYGYDDLRTRLSWRYMV